MVSIRYKSFILGIILTSITWCVILYLYSVLSENKFFLENNSDNFARWKLRPRVNNLHRIAQIDSISYESKEQRMKYNFINKKGFPDREANMIDNNELDYNAFNHKSAKDNFEYKWKKDLKILNSTDLVHLGMINSPQDQKIKDEGYKKHAFNLLISDRIGYRRMVPYTAHPM